MLEIRVNPDKTVQIPLIGTFFTYQGESYVVLRTTTYQEQGDDTLIPVFTTIALILRVNDEGDDLGEETKEVNADELTEI